ncbi:DUF397 domain-containing protein [Streptomyces sp. NPDC050085]|uniref:DUF397 domain-containing protein n=1 Tax=Streptomyces sp. NPDC050085 TaxID=3365600 RepID=UPI0037BBE023
MARLAWQKSSYSTGGEGECVELATDPADPARTVHLRESDDPGRVATTSPRALAALLNSLKDKAC